jgi:hypothetical protein
MMKKKYVYDTLYCWEYRYYTSHDLEQREFYADGKPPLDWYSQNDNGKVVMAMNALGEECWELVGVSGMYGNGYYFKRPYRWVEDKSADAG